MNQTSRQPDLFKGQTAPGPNRIVLKLDRIPPSFKNSKMIITKNPRGKPLPRPMLITKPEYQQALKAITESFVLQLLSACQTAGGATLTGSSLRSAIAWSTPEDDSLTHIQEETVRAEMCEPGNEGCEVILERM